MEITTGAMAIAAGAYVAKEVTTDTLKKVFGPTADAIGEDFKQAYVNKRNQRANNIITKASNKIKPENVNKGSVPIQVALSVLDDGSKYDEELFAEYFAGVLASSKTELGRDDRGKCFSNLTSRLPFYQLRAHYLFYTAFKQLNNNKEINPGDITELNQLGIYIPYETFIIMMDYNIPERHTFGALLSHILHGLSKEQLISSSFMSTQDPNKIKAHYHINDKIKYIDKPGMVVLPSTLGIEYFMWVHGEGQAPTSHFFNKKFDPNMIAGIIPPIGAVSIRGGNIITGLKKSNEN